VCAGFVGVMIALNPTGASLSGASLIAIVGSLTFSILMICTRLVKGTPDIVLVTTQMVGALLFGAVTAPFAWVAMSWADLSLLLWLGVVATFAHFCINRSLKLAPASVVVPYQYTTIVWAIILGYIFFKDIPTVQMLVGAATIVAAGIYIFIREQTRAKQPPAVVEGP